VTTEHCCACPPMTCYSLQSHEAHILNCQHTSRSSLLLHCQKDLKLQILVSPSGISINRKDYITAALKAYRLAPNANVPKVVEPFPTDSKFEVELFNSLPPNLQSHTEYIKKHHGTLRKWAGIFMHAAVWTQINICYSVMRLAAYVAAPTLASYKALKHFMNYLFHMPIMYPQKQFKKKKKQMELH